MIPLPGGWIVARKQELISLSDRRYHEGCKDGMGETDGLIRSSRELIDDNTKAIKKIEHLEAEMLRLGELIDQTQRDAYTLGYSHGSTGYKASSSPDEEKEIENDEQ